METKIEGETNRCTFLWKIENMSYCWMEKGELIARPCFTANTLEGTKWSLLLYPMGDTDENYIACYLYREKNCDGPNVIRVNFQIAILDENGSFLTEGIKGPYNIFKGEYTGYPKYVERKEVFITKKEAYLPEDSLTVQCSIWKEDETPIKTEHIFARSVFKVNKRSFVWRINEFSTVKPGLRNVIKDDIVQMYFVLNKLLDFEKMLEIDINSFDKSIKYFSFKFAIINSEGEKEECGKHEYFAGDVKKIYSSSMPLFSKMLMENKHRYLQNDVLLIYCEYLYANGKLLHEIFNCGITSPEVTKLAVRKATPQQTPVLAKDFKSLYEEGIFSDVELRTSTKTFPVHKNILSARSPVFKRMFSNDMKEKNSGHVDIIDLEDDTIHQMLLYIYTDTLEDLQFSNACKLYTVADKYEILSLRNKCSSFLKENLCPTKACDVLILADLHHDNDLKSAVQDHILSHDKEVFGSQEWQDFMDIHPKLAAKIMYRKVFTG